QHFTSTTFNAPRLHDSTRSSRQLDPETAAFARRGFESDAAAHALNAFAHNGQTNACARIAFGAMESFEDFKDTLLVRRGDSNAVVLDPEAHNLAAILGSDAYLRGCALAHEF